MSNDASSLPGENHWNSHAVRWDLLGSPLRPSSDDLAVVASAVSELVPRVGNRSLDTLILGVTPEYARFPWPPGSHLVAMECSALMIRHVWPGSTAASEQVIQDDWLSPQGSMGPFDLVLGDGVLSQLDYPGDYHRLLRMMRRVTRPGGHWILRLYARPAIPEDPERPLDDVSTGRLTNINEFKLRMGMLLCDAHHADDVAVDEMWRFWDRARRRNPALQDRWLTELQSTIENYRDTSAKYSFPRLDPVLDILRSFAAVRTVSFPSYPFGGCCPTVVLAP